MNRTKEQLENDLRKSVEYGYECEKKIEILQNTLNHNLENSNILEETIGKLIDALDKIEKQEYNLITSYSIRIAKNVLENL